MAKKIKQAFNAQTPMQFFFHAEHGLFKKLLDLTPHIVNEKKLVTAKARARSQVYTGMRHKR